MLIILLINLLLSNAFSFERDKSILYSRLGLKSLLLSSFLVLNNTYIKSFGTGVGLYGGLFNITGLTNIFNLFIFLISVIILTFTAFYPRKVYMEKSKSSSYNNWINGNLLYNNIAIDNKLGGQFRILEYPLIIVFILCGGIFLMSSGDIISIFLSIELQSYGLYILCTLYRDSESATASGLTYFLLGGLSSCFILLGSSLLYANSGTTSLENLFIITSISEINWTTTEYLYKAYYLHLALTVMIGGVLFKISAAPFHFWSPDVYDGIPTIVTSFVAIVAKLSIFILLLELVYHTQYYILEFSWKNILLISSLLSLIIGSILGITQFRIKRLFAYSTISHVGFILLALSINTSESIQSYIFYILQYTLSNLNAFVILISIGFSLYTYTYKKKEYENNLVDQNNSPIQLISQIKGYFYINPYISICLAITLFSFVGIPPITGFFAKQMILSAALDSGYIFMSLVAILTSVIAAAYYLNLVKEIFFYKHDYKINFSQGIGIFTFPKLFIFSNSIYTRIRTLIINTFFYSRDYVEVIKPTQFNNKNITINGCFSFIIALITLLLILFIYMPDNWFNLVNILTLIIFRS